MGLRSIGEVNPRKSYLARVGLAPNLHSSRSDLNQVQGDEPKNQEPGHAQSTDHPASVRAFIPLAGKMTAS
jgi:hypothetical protein